MNETSTKQSASRLIVGVSYVFPNDVASESRSGDKVTITLNAGKAWNPIYFTPGSAKLLCSSSRQFEGNRIVNQFEMGMPGGGGAFDKDVQRICNRHIILALLYSDGETLIAGGKKRKLRLEYKSSSEVVSSYVVSFDYTVSEPFKVLN